MLQVVKIVSIFTEENFDSHQNDNARDATKHSWREIDYRFYLSEEQQKELT